MSQDKLSEYLIFRETTKRLLLVIGLWPGEQPGLLCRLFTYLQIIFSFGTIMAISSYVRVNVTNVAALTKSMGILISYVTVVLKLSWMFLNRERVAKLHQMLDPCFMDFLSRPNQSQIILDGVTTFRRLSLILTALTGVAASLYIFMPLVFVVYQHLHHVENIKYILIYPAIYPWDITPNGFLYKLHYISEATPNIALLCVTAGVDSLFILHVFQMIGRLRDMSYCILHIGRDSNYKKAVRECVSQHETLIECRDILEKVYGPMILWIMVTNAIILCSLMFQLSQMKSMSVGRVIMFSTYLGLKLTQTLMYALAGTYLTDESEKYAKAVYAAEWNSNKEFMTSILIMLEQRPLILTACNFSVVSIDIFIMVLNTTVSYFFLLRAIQHQN